MAYDASFKRQYKSPFHFTRTKSIIIAILPVRTEPRLQNSRFLTFSEGAKRRECEAREPHTPAGRLRREIKETKN